MAEQFFRARDRATKKVGTYADSFLKAWPDGYFILGPAEDTKTKKPSDRAASLVPKGTNPEGGA